MKRVWEDVKKKAADEPLIRIVDDEDEVRESLGFMLECEGFRTASYASGAEFLRDFDSGRPGVVLLDVRMPELSGPELQQRLNAMHSKVPVVFITSYSDIQAAIDTLKAGAADFLLKPVDPEKLITLVRILTERSTLAAEGAEVPSSLASAVASLTDRPRSVLELMMQGLDNAAIAEHLGLSVRTVEVHRAAVYKALGVHSVRRFQKLMPDLGKILGEAGPTS